MFRNDLTKLRGSSSPSQTRCSVISASRHAMARVARRWESAEKHPRSPTSKANNPTASLPSVDGFLCLSLVDLLVHLTKGISQYAARARYTKFPAVWSFLRDA